MTAPRFLFCASGEGGVMKKMLGHWRALRMPGHVAGVLSDRDCPALQWAKENGYETRMVPFEKFSDKEEFNRSYKDALDSFTPDFALLNYNRLLAPALTQAYRNRLLNLHYALLPSFTGLGSARRAVEMGARIAGVTAHFIDETMDGGPIVAQAALSVNALDDGPALMRRYFLLAVPLFMQCARWLGEGRITVEGKRIFIKGADYNTMPIVPALDADIAAWAGSLT
jgi:phosphoribosylglycinamide formyltransferase-1